MQLGYNTNGFGFHRLDDVFEIVAELGYRVIAITPDIHHLDPFRVTSQELAATRRRLDELGLTCVIETGARFILDPRRKHRPTLLDDDPALRIDFLERCIDMGDMLGAKVVSAWSGAMPTEGDSAEQDRETLMRKLGKHVRALVKRGEEKGISFAMEPEPGFLVETMADYDDLCDFADIDVPLTLDVGHLKCVEMQPEASFIKRYAKRLVNVQLDDMVPGVHRHLPFWEGEVDFDAVFAALREINYQGPACVELSEGSRDAVNIARRSMEFLKAFELQSVDSVG